MKMKKVSPLAVSNWTPGSEALTRERVPIKRQERCGTGEVWGALSNGIFHSKPTWAGPDNCNCSRESELEFEFEN